MIEITLDLKKSIDENAAIYYERSKKAKKKLSSIDVAIQNLKDKLDSLKPKESLKKEVRKKEWFEKFKWFVSSEDFLVIAGRDTTTNDIIVKKYTDDADYVFHTELPGSPFVIIKTEGKTPSKVTFEECAIFCASHSRSWSEKRGNAEVYMVRPDQVKKELGLPKGTFMVHGKRTYYTPTLELAVGMYDGKVMVAPLSAVKKHCEKFYIISLGNDKKSDIAKKLKKLLNASLDELMQALPPGDAKIRIP